MSYTFDLLRLPTGVDPEQAYKKQSEANERRLLKTLTAPDREPPDPRKEEAKQRLAKALTTRHPTLKIFQPDYEELATSNSIDVSEAKRTFRDVELNEEEHAVQIVLFDDSAGASLSSSGSAKSCVSALRFLWHCLEILESEGGFSTYDPQVGKVLDLGSDFDAVQRTACGVANDHD